MGSETEPRTLLMVHPGSLGDVLLSLSAIRSLRAAFPSHTCGLLAGGSVGRLLAVCREVDVLFPLEQGGLTGLFAGPESVDPSLREWLNRSDLVVGWMGDSDGSLTRTFQTIGAANVVVHSPHASDLTSLHQSDRCLEIIRSFVPPVTAMDPLRLPPPFYEEARARLTAEAGLRGRLMIALHPGSGSPHKCCAPMLFAQLVEQLQVAGLVPVLVGGPGDEERIAMVIAACATQPMVVKGLDLSSMAAFLSQAAMFIGQDSGLTHVVSMLAVPTLALFGPTDPARWGPRGSHVEVMRGEPCTCIEWNVVRNCVDRPCLRISAERVMERCRKSLRMSTIASPAAP